jgi:hypothetical protein
MKSQMSRYWDSRWPKSKSKFLARGRRTTTPNPSGSGSGSEWSVCWAPRGLRRVRCAWQSLAGPGKERTGFPAVAEETGD